ncbi:hypothetical protein HBH70_209890 [Parastagonospora nodorum]|nr:hypothetical protein HBH52_167450 [Parastagonospora nodorum]KAH3972126.1 hypothetical protein HBH51_105780 [Parastagonospora nodorum]KAH4086453.1 hypothetical protein HBH46_204600 [Parastagonospora nodorum]KAH4116621.1 hypothetical protein HBH47_165100 [Parastagonospora nodorum]KAH4164821.1 hypothetical protein HBH43_145930 [Parastagonospora nodorum]
MVYAIERVARESHQHHKILTPTSDMPSHSELQESILTFVCPMPSESGTVWQTYQIEVHANTEYGDKRIKITRANGTTANPNEESHCRMKIEAMLFISCLEYSPHRPQALSDDGARSRACIQEPEQVAASAIQARLSAKVQGKLPLIGAMQAPIVAKPEVLQKVNARGLDLYVLAQDPSTSGLPNRWLPVSALSIAARDAITVRRVEAVTARAATTKWRRLAGRGQKEVTSNAPVCVQCDITLRNRRQCTYTLGKTVPDTNAVCDKCLDDQYPCRRLKDHPSGIGYAVGFVPVPSGYRLASVAWDELAYWIRQQDDWKKLNPKPPKAKARDVPSGGVQSSYSTRGKEQEREKEKDTRQENGPL